MLSEDSGRYEEAERGEDVKLHSGSAPGSIPSGLARDHAFERSVWLASLMMLVIASALVRHLASLSAVCRSIVLFRGFPAVRATAA
jgi:hypothetical protein